MFKKFKAIARDKRGLTLIELLAVMAILAILAAIIAPAVSGQGAVAGQTQSQEAGETITSEAVALTATVNGSTISSTDQETSDNWPELFIAAADGTTSTAVYVVEFPTSNSDTNGTVTAVTITDLDGNDITGETLLADYSAVDFDTLKADGFILSVPDSASSLSSDLFHNFLWLLRKETSAGSSTEDDSRKLTVFRLNTVTVTDDASESGTLPAFDGKVVTLAFVQIF